MNNSPPNNRRALALLALAMVFTFAVYWPSLQGAYLFDDGVSFVENIDVHVTTSAIGDWLRAAMSQCNSNLFCRPLGALTFAANYYFSGLNPFWPKLTNLVIHLANGFVLFLCVNAVFRLTNAVRGRPEDHSVAAAFVAAAWLLLPINLTGVAYVSQRVEALAHLFVFIGLYAYARERLKFYEGRSRGFMLPVILALFTALGILAKEDAALLPLYAACMEFAITGFRDRNGRLNRLLLMTYTALLVVPLIAGLLWIAPRSFSGVSDYRDFTIGERLLTESRVLIDYIVWTLFPNLNELTFYHDDIAVSRGLFQPITTALSIAALTCLLVLALRSRSRRPLFCLGILWFFAGHAMTATVIPLELVFEHRNYFPSAGLLLSITALVAFEPGIPLRFVRTVLACAAIALFSFVTFLRAEEWSDPIRFAYSEALKRPQSPRAQYELARTLIVAAKRDADSPLMQKSVEILQIAADRPETGVLPLQALIYVTAIAHHPIDPRWWESMAARLRDTAPSQADVGAVIFLFHCQLDGDCPKQTEELYGVFTAALTRSRGNVNLVAAYADFAVRYLHDGLLAEQMAREAVAARPGVPVYRANLVRILVDLRDWTKVDEEMTNLRAMNRLHDLDAEIAKLESEIVAIEAQTPLSGCTDGGQTDTLCEHPSGTTNPQ